MNYYPAHEIEDDPEAYYAECEYALRPRNVTCYACGRTGTGSQMDLEKQKWTLSKVGEWCPSHWLEATFAKADRILADFKAVGVPF